MQQHTPKIIITTGEPAGIGPDVSLHLAFHDLPVEVVLLGDANLLKQRAQALNLNIEFYCFNAEQNRTNGKGQVAVFNIPLCDRCAPGILNPNNAPYVLEMLNMATTLCLDKVGAAMITAPVHKAVLNQASQPFIGHTEYLGGLCHSETLMTFYSPDCLLGLATTHLPLKNVSRAITQEHLTKTLHQFISGFKTYFQIDAPKIGVLGLNPHAGESGTLGDEDDSIIQPVIQTFKNNGYQIKGPLPGDTAFNQENRSNFDGIFAMFHDQGLAPMKALYFEQLVNVTFGLPFLRTSVDHGTALNLAASGHAKPKSLLNALTLTHQLISS